MSSAPRLCKWNKKRKPTVSKTKRNALHAALSRSSAISMQLYLLTKTLMSRVLKGYVKSKVSRTEPLSRRMSAYTCVRSVFVEGAERLGTPAVPCLT